MPIAYLGDRHQLFCTPYSNKSRDNGAPFIYYRLSRVKCGKTQKYQVKSACNEAGPPTHPRGSLSTLGRPGLKPQTSDPPYSGP